MELHFKSRSRLPASTGSPPKGQQQTTPASDHGLAPVGIPPSPLARLAQFPHTVQARHGHRLASKRISALLEVEEPPGRIGPPGTAREIGELIRDMRNENVLWGATRLHGELLKLGIEVSQATVAKYMVKRPKPPSHSDPVRLFSKDNQLQMPGITVWQLGHLPFLRRTSVTMNPVRRTKTWRQLGQ